MLLSFALFVQQTHSQTQTKNYIKSSVPQTENGVSGNSLHTVQYIDGLGRPDQTIQIGVSPNGYDMVQPIDYDEFGREKKKYLPYTLTSSGGTYVSSELDPNKWAVYGSTEKNFAYAETEFESSPLNRVVAQGAPGSAWQVTGSHKLQIEYGSNLESEVLLFVINGDELKQNGSYDANQLYKTITKDENWTVSQGKLHTTEEFKDKLGQVVLKRGYVGNSSTPTKVDIYYVYDDFGLLRYVLPPKAIKVYQNGGSSTYIPEIGYKVIESRESLSSVEANTDKYFVKHDASLTLKPGYQFTATSSQSLLIKSEELNLEEFNELIYAYKYDARKRMIEKKLPGAKPVYMIYDDRDRLVATQDGNQREQSKWLVTKYDELNRPVLTGFYVSSKTRAKLQTEVNSFYANTNNPKFESRGSILKSYNNKSFPTGLTDANVLTANYYDDYNVTHCPQTSYNSSQILNSALLTAPKGQLTVSWVKTLNADSGKPGGLWTVNFYDKKYRVVQSYASNYLNGYDRMTNVYDFVGKVDRSVHEHKVGSSTTIESKWYNYDHAGRLTKVDLQYSGAVSKARTTIAEMSYDELGQLESKKLSAAARQMDYAYNIRGWMTGMNAHKQTVSKGKTTDEFGFTLNYNTGAGSFGGTDQYNGNIGAMEWWSNGISDVTAHRQGYGYTYDALNRITNADFKTYSSGWKDVSGYDVTGITYDLNGNIMSLNRYDSGDHIDQLGYGYNGNQLSYVNDGKDDSKGFKELSSTSLEYLYDANGNMTRDDNKKITDIDYNLLNLPEFIAKKDAGNNVRNVAYAYDAAGVKLENRLPGSKKLQYCANFVYDNGSLKYILNDEGKLNVGDVSNTYQFFVKDHLGNTRLSVRENGTVEEINHYYPFGMRMAMTNTKSDADQKYLYNGKELQDETDWLDYGARMYDAQIGRWHTTDPMEQYDSPYVYVGNNPIAFNDPTGMFGERSTFVASTFTNSSGTILEHRNDGDPRIYEVDDVDKWQANGSKKSDARFTGKYEKKGVDYNSLVGQPIGFNVAYSLYGGGHLPSGAIESDYTIESFAIPVFGFLKCIKIGKYVYKLIPTKSGKYFLRLIGLSDDVAKSIIPLTKAKFGHTFLKHGEDATSFLINRAKGSGAVQGQFLNNQKAAQFILDNINKTANGAVNIAVPKGFPARVILPDGAFKAATHIRLIPSGGGVKTAYPLIPGL